MLWRGGGHLPQVVGLALQWRLPLSEVVANALAWR